MIWGVGLHHPEPLFPFLQNGTDPSTLSSSQAGYGPNEIMNVEIGSNL